MNKILEADSILFRIDDRNLLTDIYINCQQAEIVGLLGQNGCGKSTLLKIIFGTLPCVYKHIRLNGKVCQTPFKTEMISYLPQHNFLPSNIPLHHIIKLFIPDPEKRKIIKQDKQIKAHLFKKSSELSGGERRYFELLLLLNLNSDFVLLDEPFSAIELLYKERIQVLLLTYRHQKGIIVTDHDYRQIMKVSDRLILLKYGCTKPVKNLSNLEELGYLPEGLVKQN